ncbi:hypothetical protein S7711_07067 [Stachybotrys chartarum IBT 7711]|uniref:Ferric oxidoreductase domain-containing protein n=1 Tax=Stachybotrys chartarum (strain CBS 109288 / IBT 7711) TaxID=1280523 RepID=A0A084AP63_STACB|nr:hypothetical protein S7711_07067 [Stachybotrys chartarum IBT 7711]
MLPTGMRLAGLLAAAVSSLLAAPATAQSTGRPGHGLIGYGITMYQPACAFACRSSLPRSSIPCEVHLHGHHSSSVSAECLADSDAFLMSAAWCIHERCPEENVEVSAIERFWETDMVGRHLDQPAPKWSYQESLHHAMMEDPPSTGLEEDEVFNRTVAVGDEDYISNWNGNSAFEAVEGHHEEYGLVILLTGAAIPIFLSLLRFLPLPASVVSRFYAYIIEPPAFGRYHAVPVMGLGFVPTRGQALFILYIILINVVFCCVSYNPRRPNSWYTRGMYEELANYIANRAGVLSFANLPLLILYAGRNNILLWVTNWSHSTFLLLHRWIAFICMLQAVLHSAIWLHMHVAWYQDHDEVAALAYWYWGIIATLALVILIPISVLPLRKMAYELFHALHILFAILAIVGCWYHIIYRYQRQWGYENWVIMASVIWAFDWVLRAARLVGGGIKRGYVTRIDDDYIQVDVPGVFSHGHSYAYFPTLTWRVWESHPFSIAGIAYQGSQMVSSAVSEVEETKGSAVVTSTTSASSISGATRTPSGIRFFIRVEKGTTSLLAARAGRAEGVPLLLETYGGASVLHKVEHPNAVFIAGGVGVTAILPKVISAQGEGQAYGSKKLYWGVRSGAEGLVHAVQDLVAPSEESALLRRGDGLSRLRWSGVDVHVSVGERLDLRTFIEAEVAANKMGTTVVVCGPAGLADEVRLIVTALGRNGAVVKLEEESFAW